MDEHRAAESFEVVCPDHHAEQAERVFVRHLDHVRLFLKQYSADYRVLHHVLPRHHYPVTLVEERRVFCGDVVDLCVFVYVLDRLCFTGNDQADVSFMPFGSG